MASKAQIEDRGDGARASDGPCDGRFDDEAVTILDGSMSSERLPKHRQEKSKQHVIMINKSGCQTVVSSGGSGHVQHVSVVGHVQQLGQQAEGAFNTLGSEADELPSKRKEKSTSFKITNVYLSRPPSNDGDESGDDNEDLEDSHTEDLSDIIDNLSSLALKDTALGSANTNVVNSDRHKPPSAQSSSQETELQVRKPSNVSIHRRQSADKDWENSLPPYSHPGFGFVTYHQTGNTFHPVSYLDKTVSGAVAVFNSMECSGELSSSSQPVVVGPQDFKTRFKVVKVETTEPLKRGRWTCIDFTDKHSTQEVSKPVSSTSSMASVSKPTTKTCEILPSRPGSALTRDTVETVITGDSNTPDQTSALKSEQEVAEVSVTPVIEEKEVEVRGSSAGPEIGRLVTATNSSSLHISLSQSQQQTVPVITATPSLQSPHTTHNMPDFSAIQNSLGQVIRLNDGTLAQVALAPIPQQQQPIVKIIPSSTNQQMVHPQQQQVMVNAQGQHFLVSNQQQNPSQVPQQSNRSQIGQQPPQPQSAPTQQANSRSQQQQQQHPIRSQAVTASLQQPAGPSLVGHQAQNVIQAVIPNPTLPMQSQPGIAQPQATSTAGIVNHQPPPATSGIQQQTLGVSSVTRVVSTPVSQSLVMSTAISTTAPTHVSHSHLYNAPFGPPPAASLDSAFSVVNNVIGLEDGDGLVERLEEMVSNRLAEDQREGELDESASGAGQGSIDHRIEQAMDLVKSHLMSAVRSEVEELRDKISKLEDTVNHLSRENEVLRANVNPEVVASLLGNRSILGGLPPDPALHTALPPPNQH